jgi:hypothetical protein
MTDTLDAATVQAAGESFVDRVSQPWSDPNHDVMADLDAALELAPLLSPTITNDPAREGWDIYYPTVAVPARDCRVVHGEVSGPLRDLVCRRGHSVRP